MGGKMAKSTHDRWDVDGSYRAPSDKYSNVYRSAFDESSQKTLSNPNTAQGGRSRSLPYNNYMPGTVYPQRASLTPHLPMPTTDFAHSTDVVHCTPKRYKQ
ncbi:hypothetical protein Tcan_13287 [Toxocara canis]|uniref:Uncharacterized protein n=1 Tax=Toxocara canis TaxID=6265 RepID=A0A0B2VPS0_TOXCA|nr:hypothetical protein Tcan_13287 [Toxocara canis]